MFFGYFILSTHSYTYFPYACRCVFCLACAFFSLSKVLLGSRRWNTCTDTNTATPITLNQDKLLFAYDVIYPPSRRFIVYLEFIMRVMFQLPFLQIKIWTDLWAHSLIRLVFSYSISFYLCLCLSSSSFFDLIEQLNSITFARRWNGMTMHAEYETIKHHKLTPIKHLVFRCRFLEHCCALHQFQLFSKVLIEHLLSIISHLQSNITVHFLYSFVGVLLVQHSSPSQLVVCCYVNWLIVKKIAKIQASIKRVKIIVILLAFYISERLLLQRKVEWFFVWQPLWRWYLSSFNFVSHFNISSWKVFLYFIQRRIELFCQSKASSFIVQWNFFFGRINCHHFVRMNRTLIEISFMDAQIEWTRSKCLGKVPFFSGYCKFFNGNSKLTSNLLKLNEYHASGSHSHSIKCNHQRETNNTIWKVDFKTILLDHHENIKSYYWGAGSKNHVLNGLK